MFRAEVRRTRGEGVCSRETHRRDGGSRLEAAQGKTSGRDLRAEGILSFFLSLRTAGNCQGFCLLFILSESKEGLAKRGEALLVGALES